MIHIEYPVHTRVVNTHNGLRRSGITSPLIGQRGTVLGYMTGTSSGKDRLLVLFDGERFAVQKNPKFVRKDTP